MHAQRNSNHSLAAVAASIVTALGDWITLTHSGYNRGPHQRGLYWGVWKRRLDVLHETGERGRPGERNLVVSNASRLSEEDTYVLQKAVVSAKCHSLGLQAKSTGRTRE